MDYALSGATFDEGGIIVIDCELYSEQAQQFVDDLDKIRIELGENNNLVYIALLQIAAEEKFKLHASSEKDIIDGLKKLDENKWCHIDDFDLLDTKYIRRKSDPLYLTHQHQPIPRKIHIKLIPDQDLVHENRKLLPLFDVIGRILTLTLINKLIWRYGLYAGCDLVTHPAPTSLSSELWSIQKVFKELDLDEIAKYSHDVVRLIASDQTIEHIVSEFSSVSYEKRGLKGSDYSHILSTTKIFVGAKGWKEIATTENINLLMNNTSLELKLGRQKVNNKLV